MMNRVAGWCAFWVAQSALVGCFEVNDLIRAEPAPDASVVMAQTGDAGDASVVMAQTGDAGDASVVMAQTGDAGQDPSLTGPDAARSLCDVAHPCGANDLCAPDGLCLPRCDANGICVAVSSPSGFSAFVADGTTLYLASKQSHDVYGNAHDDAAMWSLSAAGELRKVHAFSDPPKWQKTLLQDESYLYWVSATQVWRMRKDGSAEPQAIYPAAFNSRIALLPNDKIVHWYNVPNTDSSCAFEVGSRDGSTPLRLANAGHEMLGCRFVAFGDGKAYIAPQKQLEVQSIDLTSGEATNTGFLGEPFAVVPPYVYTSDDLIVVTLGGAGVQIYRSDLRSPSLPRTVVYRAPDDESPWGPRIKTVIGDHLYQLSLPDGSSTARVELVRSSTVDLGNRDRLLPKGFAVPSAYYVDDEMLAVTESHAFLVAHLGTGNTPKDGGILYSVPLPAR